MQIVNLSLTALKSYFIVFFYYYFLSFCFFFLLYSSVHQHKQKNQCVHASAAPDALSALIAVKSSPNCLATFNCAMAAFRNE